MQQKEKSKRGFASMNQEQQRAIARKGGESVPPEKRSFSQNPGLAAKAGAKGGSARSRVKKRQDPKHNEQHEAL